MSAALIVVGDFNPKNESHLATNAAIRNCSAALGVKIDARWIGTEDILAPAGLEQVTSADGLWIGPASPYRSMDGALTAIRVARENGIPLLGTCGGFQHIIIEYARNVLAIADAEHEESSPSASRLIISRLACSLAGRTMTIRLDPNSTVGRAYGNTTTQERYRCNFGVNPGYAGILEGGRLRVVASDDEGTVRAVELSGHPFFVGTLFLPQHSSSPAAPHPLITAFLKTCAAREQPVAAVK